MDPWYQALLAHPRMVSGMRNTQAYPFPKRDYAAKLNQNSIVQLGLLKCNVTYAIKGKEMHLSLLLHFHMEQKMQDMFPKAKVSSSS